MPIKWEDRYQQLAGLQEEQLLSLARNESASVAFRSLAVEILLTKGSNAVNHPELALFLTELSPKIVIEELEHESEIEPETHPITPEITHSEPESGPFKASVTLETLSKPEVVHFPDDQD